MIGLKLIHVSNSGHWMHRNKPLPYMLITVSNPACNWFVQCPFVCPKYGKDIIICEINMVGWKLPKKENKARRGKIRQDKTRRGGTWTRRVPKFWKILYIFLKEDIVIRTIRADPGCAPIQWGMTLLCNDVSLWLGASLESALDYCFGCPK